MRFLLRFIGHGTISKLVGISATLTLIDFFGIAVIFPYLSIIAAESLQPGSHAAALYELTRSTSRTQFALLLSVALGVFFVGKLLVSYWLSKMRHKTNAQITIRLSNRLFELLLNANYSALTATSVSETAGIINAETIHAALCLEAWVLIASELLLLVFVFATVVWFDLRLALVLAAAMVVLTAVLYFGVMRRTARLGAEQADIHLKQYRFLFGVVSAIKDIKILSLERSVAREHADLNARYASAVAMFNTYQTLPRGIVELVAMLGLLGAASAVLMMKMDVKTAIPVIGLLAVAAWRVIPSYSRIVSAFGTYKYYKASLSVVARLQEFLSHVTTTVRPDPRPFQQSIEIRNLRLSHGNTPVLNGVSLAIRKGDSVGIVGLSGSGKTTFLDVLAGLRSAEEGEFLLDGVIFDPFKSDTLRRLLGYVPQNVTLIDDSIAFNITFEKNFDEQRLRNAARIARIGSFVEALPGGYATIVGENGVRVSGGQKQRIGIARALYRMPQIIIFDEATSALDNVTEQELNVEIGALAGDKTLIIVAHRLTTVARCNVIHVLDSGRIVGSGKHDELLAGCEAYRQLYLQGRDSRADDSHTGGASQTLPAGTLRPEGSTS